MQSMRTILAVVLSMAVLFIYYTWFAAPPKQAPEEGPPQKREVTAETLPVKERDPLKPPVSSEDDLLAAPPSAGEAPAREVVIENEAIQAVFSTKGGVLTHWKLKDYRESVQKDAPLTDLLSNDVTGAAFLLTVGENAPYPQPIYSVEQAGKDKIVLTRQTETLSVRKVIEFKENIDPHFVDITVEITNEGEKDLFLRPRLWIIRSQKKIDSDRGFFSFLRGPQDYFNPVLFVDGKVKAEKNWEKLPRKTEKLGKIYWNGLTDRYFVMGLISRHGTGNIEVEYGKTTQGEVYSSLSYGKSQLRSGESLKQKYSAYLGPKKRGELKKLGVYLEKVVDYGWFSFLAVPLLWLLIFFQKIVINWGLAIIALTFFVKMLLHPVNKKSMQSMKAMQKLQPKLKEIREKYKNNKEKLNMEMMSLFKTHKVNPMGGCLPLLLQMPVYIALYKVLWNSIELYQVPFFWFYKDLSAPDPYLVSPILLGIFMALQQKLTPAPSADPAQQKMMMIMPLMFSAFMIFLPSGLVIYIFVNTVVSVVQQYMIHREINFWDLIKKLRTAGKKA